MPELPEVQTTVDGLNKTVKGKKIVGVSTTYRSAYHRGKDNIKDPKFFSFFKKKVLGQKILKAERRAKNILMHLTGGHTMLVHMKMTGHFVYDRPDYPFIRLSFTFEGGKSLSFSDMRKFAKVTVVETDKLHESLHLSSLGPEPLEKNFSLGTFTIQLLKKPRVRIKTALMDQSLISGIGNIYSDEILWRASVHPNSIVSKIPKKNFKLMFLAMKEVLKSGIDMGGDSMSDYRNIQGEKGKFQEHHRAYRRKGLPCQKRGCNGKIERIVVGTRSAHFCPVHQKLYV